MARRMVYSGLVAGLMCGCQSADCSRQCDDCLPPKSVGYGYMPKVDEYVTKKTAVGCANDDLKELGKSCGKTSKDFETGFRQAYVDLSLGRPARAPAVPPREYWTAYYRSCAGAPAVDDWFAGYQAGLEWGLRGGVSRFNRIAHLAPGGCPTPSLPAGPGGWTLPNPAAPGDAEPWLGQARDAGKTEPVTPVVNVNGTPAQ